jgi:branched-chain amino acid transport system substrate-binding protein
MVRSKSLTSLFLAACVLVLFICDAYSAAKKEILIGAVNTMTGAGAMVGEEHRWAYEQAINDINAKGGVFVKELNKKLPLRLIVADDRTDPAQAASAAERLIKRDKVDFLLGTTQGPLNIAASAVAEKYKKLYVATTFFPEDFLAQKYSWVAVSFFYASELLRSSVATMNVLPKDIRPKKVCVIVPDTPEGQAFGGGASKIVPGEGYELTLYETYTEGTKDLSPSVLKMKKAGVEAIVYFGHSTDGITLIRQIKEHDYNPKYIWGARGLWPVEFYDALKSDADYIVSDGHWSEALGYGVSKELGSRFRKQFGGKTSVTIGNFYSIVQALAQAIEEAGSIDGKKVRDVFYSGKFVAKNTTNGDLKFNEKGLAVIPPVALQWYKGERMPVYPPAPNIWTLKVIPPWKKR